MRLLQVWLCVALTAALVSGKAVPVDLSQQLIPPQPEAQQPLLK